MAGEPDSRMAIHYLESLLKQAGHHDEHAEAISELSPFLSSGPTPLKARAAKILSEAASDGIDISNAIPALVDSLESPGNVQSHAYAALLKAAGDDRTKDAVALHVTAHLAHCTIHSWAASKELLVVSATNGAGIDLAALRGAMRSFMENGKNGWIRRFPKIDVDRMVPHAYMQIAEAVRMRKLMYSERPSIWGDGLGLEPKINPPKGGRDDGNMFRIQTIDPPNAPCLVKGVG